jgi:hypothetical protein
MAVGSMQPSQLAFPLLLMAAAGQTCIAQGTFTATGAMQKLDGETADAFVRTRVDAVP